MLNWKCSPHRLLKNIRKCKHIQSFLKQKSRLCIYWQNNDILSQKHSFVRKSWDQWKNHHLHSKMHFTGKQHHQNMKNNWFNVCFSLRGRAGGIRVRKWLFPSKWQSSHPNHNFDRKIHFCAETCSGGLRGAIRSNVDAKGDFILRHSKGGP